MRDQIKVWLGSSDIKDKSALLENRKLIETVSTKQTASTACPQLTTTCSKWSGSKLWKRK